MGRHPEKAIGYGGRARRVTGDQYDFFSIDFDYGNGVSSHNMCRQVDSCANGTGEIIMGTDGYTNCQNTIWDHNGNVIWEFEYPKDENEKKPDHSVYPSLRSGTYAPGICYQDW